MSSTANGSPGTLAWPNSPKMTPVSLLTKKSVAADWFSRYVMSAIVPSLTAVALGSICSGAIL